MTRKVLHVGCGPKNPAKLPAAFRAADWREVRLDINPAVQPDIVGSMTDMSMVADGAFDGVYSSHNIEHLYAHEVPAALKEFRRVLGAKGFLVVTCPDLQSVAALVAEDKLTDVAYQSPAGPISPIDMIYGHRASMARGNLFMAHRCGFTLKVLANTLAAAGFAQVLGARERSAYALWAVATKSKWPDATARDLARRFLPKGALDQPPAGSSAKGG